MVYVLRESADVSRAGKANSVIQRSHVLEARFAVDEVSVWKLEAADAILDLLDMIAQRYSIAQETMVKLLALVMEIVWRLFASVTKGTEATLACNSTLATAIVTIEGSVEVHPSSCAAVTMGMLEIAANSQ